MSIDRVKKRSLSRRRLLFEGGSSLALVGAGQTLARPALALSEEFLRARGDLRIGLLSTLPPYDMSLGEGTSLGLLPSIARNFARELWLSPSYVRINDEDILSFTPQDLFQRNGGIDLIVHAPKKWAQQHNVLVSDVYIRDQLNFITVPNLSQIAIFPTNFYESRVLAYPDYLIKRMVASTPAIERVRLSYQLKREDLFTSLPLEMVLRGEFEHYIAPHNQLRWMLKNSSYNFYLNEMFFQGQSAVVEFCVMVNPNSPWILPVVNKVLRALVAEGKMIKILHQYHLSPLGL